MMKHTQKGFTLFIAIVITSALAVLAIGIISLVVRESLITDSSRESQYAFYAADTGAECAIYWDITGIHDPDNFPTMISPFVHLTPEGSQFTGPVNCNRDLLTGNGSNQYTVNHIYSSGFSTSTISGQPYFTVTFKPDPYCAKVTVVKGDNGTTKIESLGYNTCDTSNPHRVERAVRVTY